MTGLPINERDPTAGTDLPQQPVVLVTDDHEDTRSLIRVFLTMRGCSVIEAADGEEAVQIAETLRPDLILMDGFLPRLDGLGATRRIRALSDGHTPIVFICGRAEPSFRARALEAGCDEYLLKPVSFDLLGSVLDRHLPQTTAINVPPAIDY
jgi:CheY-like chemotaxis protein